LLISGFSYFGRTQNKGLGRLSYLLQISPNIFPLPFKKKSKQSELNYLHLLPLSSNTLLDQDGIRGSLY